jgi:hypothetical protein
MLTKPGFRSGSGTFEFCHAEMSNRNGGIDSLAAHHRDIERSICPGKHWTKAMIHDTSRSPCGTAECAGLRSVNGHRRIQGGLGTMPRARFTCSSLMEKILVTMEARVRRPVIGGSAVPLTASRHERQAVTHDRSQRIRLAGAAGHRRNGLESVIRPGTGQINRTTRVTSINDDCGCLCVYSIARAGHPGTGESLLRKRRRLN